MMLGPGVTFRADTTPRLAEHLADLLTRDGDGWPAVLASLCDHSGGEVAVAITVGPPVRRLGGFGPLPMQACVAGDEAALRAALAGAGLRNAWVGAFRRGER